MLTNVKGHLIDKSKIIYISPVYSSTSHMFREVGSYFKIKLEDGTTIKIDDVDYYDTLEERRDLLKKHVDVYKKLEELRNSLV